MKLPLTLLLLCSFCLTANAQTEAITINIGGVRSTDSVIKNLHGIIGGPIGFYPFATNDWTWHLKRAGFWTVRNNDYYDDRLDMELLFGCTNTSPYPNWTGCDVNNNSFYNYTASDALFQSYTTGGFQPLLRLGGEYTAPGHTHDSYVHPINTAEDSIWCIAAKKVTQHYSSLNNFPYLNIWTEYPGPHFWDASRSETDFFNFWKKAYDTLHLAYPALKIGGPGFSPFASYQLLNNVSLGIIEKFLRSLYPNRAPQWLGFHVFSNDPSDHYNTALKFRAMLDATGDYTSMPWAGTNHFANTEIFEDAWGLSSMSAPNSDYDEDERDSLFNKTTGGAIWASSWASMQFAPIERAYYYRAGDNSIPGSVPPSTTVGQNGLFHRSSSVNAFKPMSYAAMMTNKYNISFTKILNTASPVSGSLNSKIWSLAALAQGDSTAVLIPNNTDHSLNVTVTKNNLPVSNYYTKLLLYTINDTDSGLIAIPQSTASVISVAAGNTVLAVYSNVVLPVTLTRFDLKKRSDAVELFWNTASEANNCCFIVERSIDGFTFNSIGNVTGAGNSTHNIDYNFTDIHPLSGMNYYRLKQLGTDGTTTYSEVKSIQFNNNGISIYPTIVKTELTINTSLLSSNTLLEITDVSGKALLVTKLYTGLSKQVIDVSQLGNGVYFAVITVNNSRYTTTFVKL
jgi:hypothetical protein